MNVHKHVLMDHMERMGPRPRPEEAYKVADQSGSPEG